MSGIQLVSILAAILVLTRQATPQQERRCQLFCQVMELGEQCDHCRSRTPVRFGKRSREIELRVQTMGDEFPRHSRKVETRQQQPFCGHLVTLLMKQVAKGNLKPGAFKLQLDY